MDRTGNSSEMFGMLNNKWLRLNDRDGTAVLCSAVLQAEL
jgi:hypothetical protein